MRVVGVGRRSCEYTKDIDNRNYEFANISWFVMQSSLFLRSTDIHGGKDYEASEDKPKGGSTGLKLSTSPVEIFWSGDHAGLGKVGQSIL